MDRCSPQNQTARRRVPRSPARSRTPQHGPTTRLRLPLAVLLHEIPRYTAARELLALVTVVRDLRQHLTYYQVLAASLLVPSRTSVCARNVAMLVRAHAERRAAAPSPLRTLQIALARRCELGHCAIPAHRVPARAVRTLHEGTSLFACPNCLRRVTRWSTDPRHESRALRRRRQHDAMHGPDPYSGTPSLAAAHTYGPPYLIMLHQLRDSRGRPLGAPPPTKGAPVRCLALLRAYDLVRARWPAVDLELRRLKEVRQARCLERRRWHFMRLLQRVHKATSELDYWLADCGPPPPRLARAHHRRDVLRSRALLELLDACLHTSPSRVTNRDLEFAVSWASRAICDATRALDTFRTHTKAAGPHLPPIYGILSTFADTSPDFLAGAELIELLWLGHAEHLALHAGKETALAHVANVIFLRGRDDWCLVDEAGHTFAVHPHAPWSLPHLRALDDNVRPDWFWDAYARRGLDNSLQDAFVARTLPDAAARHRHGPLALARSALWSFHRSFDALSAQITADIALYLDAVRLRTQADVDPTPSRILLAQVAAEPDDPWLYDVLEFHPPPPPFEETKHLLRNHALVRRPPRPPWNRHPCRSIAVHLSPQWWSGKPWTIAHHKFHEPPAVPPSNYHDPYPSETSLRAWTEPTFQIAAETEAAMREHREPRTEVAPGRFDWTTVSWTEREA